MIVKTQDYIGLKVKNVSSLMRIELHFFFIKLRLIKQGFVDSYVGEQFVSFSNNYHATIIICDEEKIPERKRARFPRICSINESKTRVRHTQHARMVDEVKYLLLTPPVVVCNSFLFCIG